MAIEDQFSQKCFLELLDDISWYFFPRHVPKADVYAARYLVDFRIFFK